jgi:hypothetical protein
MTGTDPTVEFLKRLADPSKWSVRENVPIFEPHVRTVNGPDGKPRQAEVTLDDLFEIADNSNRLFTDDGVPGRVTDRHTMRMRPDGKGLMEPVPNVVLFGFQKDYRVDRYGPSRKPAVMVDWYLFPEHAPAADRRPHRSVEYQHGAKLIRGTAVMVNDPFLDMGVVAFSCEERYFFQTAPAAPPPPKPRGATMERPWYHAAALQVMRDHPGEMSYEEACQYARLHCEPPHYRAAMTLMMANPGMSYSQAEAEVQEKDTPADRPADSGELNDREKQFAEKFINYMRATHKLPNFPR